MGARKKPVLRMPRKLKFAKTQTPGVYVLDGYPVMLDQENVLKLLLEIREEDWRRDATTRAADDQARTKAKKIYEVEGRVEIDDNAPTSRADGNPDKGCYVQAWVWVDDPEEESP